jgi:hypothetical protein
LIDRSNLDKILSKGNAIPEEDAGCVSEVVVVHVPQQTLHGVRVRQETTAHARKPTAALLRQNLQIKKKHTTVYCTTITDTVTCTPNKQFILVVQG